ncbi:hypothetical protein QJS10_CPB18g01423 [Acorus calamus]|uniref:Uncharacterized protein n=1 Tax=Acorus calamus TaxID=4465 RepID=A0AAV9CKA9_ACOCL|nr:hypothetical protein QJS10_CPB18g01423 [Acorus calamus]
MASRLSEWRVMFVLVWMLFTVTRITVECAMALLLYSGSAGKAITSYGSSSRTDDLRQIGQYTSL